MQYIRKQIHTLNNLCFLLLIRLILIEQANKLYKFKSNLTRNES